MGTRPWHVWLRSDNPDRTRCPQANENGHVPSRAGASHIKCRRQFVLKVAINGLGRIGRATLKIIMDTPGLDLVAANDLGTSDNVVYLLKYDTVYGRYTKAVESTEKGTLTVGEHRLQLLREKDPSRLPWKSLGVDIVFECTGAFTKREELAAHVRAGARYVIVSSPSKGDDVETIVHGVNTPQGDAPSFHARVARRTALHRYGNSRTAHWSHEGHHDHGSRVHRESGHRRLAAHSLSKRPLRCCEHRPHIHWCGSRDHQGLTRISRQVRRSGSAGTPPGRVARRHRRSCGEANNGGRGEPRVYGGVPKPALSRIVG